MKLSKRFNRIRRCMDDYSAKAMLEFESELHNLYEEKLITSFTALKELKEFYSTMYEKDLSKKDETLGIKRKRLVLENNFKEAIKEFRSSHSTKKNGVELLLKSRKELVRGVSAFSVAEYSGEQVCLRIPSALTSAYYAERMGVTGVRWVRGRCIRSVPELDCFDNLQKLLGLHVEEPERVHEPEPEPEPEPGPGGPPGGNGGGALVMFEPPIQAIPISAYRSH